MAGYDNGTFCGDRRALALGVVFAVLFLLNGGRPSRWERNYRRRAGLD